MQKVLIITYYWPPAGGPGVQRWLKFVKYLRDFNVEPIVYVPENPDYPITDSSFLKDIPADVKVYKQPIAEPYRWAGSLFGKKTKRISSGIIRSENQSLTEGLLLWIRGNFFIPDARKFWVKPSVRFLAELLQKENIKTMVTTGPPHSVHLIGLGLCQQLDLRWVADFRDPWTSIGYHKKLKLTKASQRRHKQLEHTVLNDADAIVVTSGTTKKEFEALTKVPITVITNGYDGDISQETALDTKFTISHIGSLLSGRNPKNLWKALAELAAEHPEFKSALQLQLIGVVSADVLESIRDAGLEGCTSVIGYVSHQEALAYQQGSQVLLLVEIDTGETKGIIPGKLFEYMAAKRPILGLGPKDWEVGDIIGQTNAGATFGYRADSDLKSLLLKWFQRYRQNGLEVSSKGIEAYSRRELTKKLATELLWA
ncbi:glycosyltransferase family 4 protein [Flavobacteriaceae bacterium 3-367]